MTQEQIIRAEILAHFDSKLSRIEQIAARAAEAADPRTLDRAVSAARRIGRKMDAREASAINAIREHSPGRRGRRGGGRAYHFTFDAQDNALGWSALA